MNDRSEHSCASFLAKCYTKTPFFTTQFMIKHIAAHEWQGETQVVGMPCNCAGTIHPKVGGIQV
jgi:hypothetical protein